MTTLRRSERGFALVLTIGILLVLGIATTAVVDYTVSNDHHAGRSRADQTAYVLAEAGLNNALSVLNNGSNNALSQSTLPSSEASASSAPLAGGTAKWWGVLSGSQWTLYGRGIVRSPNGALTADVRRLVSVRVTVTASLTQPYNAQAWDYVISTAVAGGNACDQTIADGPNTGVPAVVSTRLYVFGNLCVGTAQGGQGRMAGAPLQVRGKVFVNEASSSVGTATQPIAGAHLAGGCQYLANPLHANCSNGSGTDKVWASPIDAVPDAMTVPVADFAGWYVNAKPGPKQACLTVGGSPPAFDNNTAQDNSVTPVFDLTPPSSYSCRVGSQGELSWNASSKTLTVQGTVFVDGSAAIQNGALNQYDGQGTLYLGGTFLMSAGSKLCGKVSGAGCDWAGWNPNATLLGIVANATAGQDPVGVSIWLKDGQYQGALYATGKIRLEGTEQTQGPMIASEVQLGYNVSTSSQVANSFPMITTIPSGFPGAPNVHANPQPPVGYTG